MLRSDALHAARHAAKRCGYALAVHGSQVKDFDWVAIPWTDEADGPDLLVESIARSVDALLVKEPTDKPHGRRAWSIHIAHTNGRDPWYIDLSVMPRVSE